jgi:UDP-N-acetylmuramate: L-alanyl-gamma-D-glutamyl-meso-diaminopimelate ligase
VFEPRSNTARIKTLEAEFERAFAQADEVYLGPVHRIDKLEVANRFDTRAVASRLNAQGRFAQAFPSNGELLLKLKADTLTFLSGERVVTFFSNGSFDGIISDFARTAKA